MSSPRNYVALPDSDGYRKGCSLYFEENDALVPVPEAAHLLFDSEAEALEFADELENGPQWNEEAEA